MQISDNHKKKLVDLIIYYIKQNFGIVYLSKNLIDTIKIEKTNTGYKIIIPAQIYDINKFVDKGVLIYTNDGSYANQINITGGFSKKHKNYIETSINLAIQEWLKSITNEAEVKIL